MTVSLSHKENEQNWKKWQESKITFAASSWHEAGRARASRQGTKCPKGCPTSAGKPGRYGNSGGVVAFGVGHAIVVCEAAVAVQHRRSRQVSRIRASVAG